MKQENKSRKRGSNLSDDQIAIILDRANKNTNMKAVELAQGLKVAFSQELETVSEGNLAEHICVARRYPGDDITAHREHFLESKGLRPKAASSLAITVEEFADMRQKIDKIYDMLCEKDQKLELI